MVIKLDEGIIFCTVDHAVCPGYFLCRMLTHDLFAVANLLVSFSTDVHLIMQVC